MRRRLRLSKKIGVFLIVLAGLLVGAANADGATYYSRASGNWNSNTTWSLTSGGTAVSAGVFPVAGDVVNIERGYTVTVAAAATCTSLNFSTATTGNLGTLTVNSGITLTVSDAVTLNNPANANVSATIGGSGTLTCASLNVGNGTAPTTNNTTRTHTLTSTISFLTVTGNLTINSYFVNNSRIRNGVFTQNSGTLTIGGAITLVNANAANTSSFTLGNTNPTLVLGGVTPFVPSGVGISTITLNGTGATVNYNRNGDQAIFDATYTNLTLSGSGIKTYSVASARTANVLTVNSGVNLLLNGNNTLTPISAIIGGTVITQNTASIIKGSGTISFNSGSTYQHNRDGGTIPTATWDVASTCNITGMTGTSPTGLGQTFGNFTWNCSGQTGTVSTTGNIIVNGDFTVANGTFALSNGQNRTLTIAGNYLQTGGVFDFNAGTSGTTVVNIAGNFSNTAGAVSITTSGQGAPNGGFVFNGAVTQTFTMQTAGAAIWTTYLINPGSNVQLLSNFDLKGDPSNTFFASVTVNGTLDVGTFTISDNNSNKAGGSVFTLNSGGTLITANAGGVDGTFPSAYTTTSFNTAANYIFNGSWAQVTGASLTGTNNLTINNNAGVTLSGAVGVSGTLTLLNGILTTSGTNLLSVTNNATTAISGGSATSFINGPVKWTLATNQNYTFPIGKGTTYLPFGITSSAGTAPQINVEAFTGNTGGSATSPLGSLSTTEYWLASVAGGTYTNGSVSLTRQAALSGLEAIGRSATLTGAYSNLNGTVSGTSIINSDNTGNSLGYFVMAAKRSITTGTIAGSPFCTGASVSVPYTITGTFNSENIFTAQLSDGTGSFSSPTNIGTLISTTAGTISATIPGGQAAGTGYRIRVVSSDPSVTGSDNGTNLTVNTYPSAAGTISGTSSVTQGQTGVSYSVAAISNATSYVWSYSGTGVTINGTGNAVTVDFSGSATSGNLTVYGTNSCGNGTVSAAFPITVASLVKSFWYKANQGTSTTTDNSGITSWADQSGQGNDATSQNTAPVFRVSGWNFNPKVNFSSGYFLTARNGISDDMTFFAVYNSTQNTGSTSFWQTPAIIGGETSGAQNDYTLSTNYGRLYFKGTFGDNFGAQTTDTYNDGKVRIVSVTRQKSVSGNIYLYVNGAQAATAPSDNTSLTGPTKLGIGNHFGYQATAQFIGDISEVFGINNVYSATQRQGFESYLAIKYGISLGSGTAPVNYMNSAGTIIWTGNSTYQNDVHGIGRDDVYGLDQRTSRSENPGTDILTIQSGSTFSTPTNAQSGTAISDQQFFMTGHNNGSITTVSSLGSGINVIARKWYSQVTNSLATESFQFDLTGTSFGTYCKIGLLIADNENLTTNQRFVEGTLNSSILTVNDAAISGDKYFTVATLLSPTIGAIASNQTICSGDTPASLTSETTGTGFGTISYQWESSADGSNWNIINGETSSTYSPGALTQTTYYRRKTLATLGNISCISGETNVVSVTVNATLSGVTITPANGQTLCATGTGTQLAATEAGGGTITSRQWGKRSVSGGAITNISGATGITYTPIASELGSGTWYLVCFSVPECGSAIVSNEVPVTVYSPFTAGTIATTGESICYGADPGTIGSSVDASGGDGSITYKWQANGVDIASSNSATFNPPAGLATTTTYTRWAKDNTCNTSFTQSAGSWVVTVNPIPSAPTTTDGMICVGSNAILSASGATSGQIYNWYTAGTGGTPIKTSSNYTDNTYTTPTLSATTNYWVSIVNTVTGCESARTQVAAIYPVVSGDDQTRAGTDSWIGHVYKRADAIGQAPTDANAFAYYYGTITESSETLDESFGGATTCLPLTASESPRSIYTEYFAVRFRMNSTKAAGIYLADIGSDDGVRLTVDGNLVYNQWVQRGYTINSKVLFQLSGTSNLLLEYYESAVDNRISFQNFTKVPNNLISGTIQTICSGTPGSAITANNALTDAPISNTSGFTVTYQWQQSADQVNWSDISGATAQNYTPTGLMTGTYYFRRKLTVSRTNPGTIIVSAVDYSSIATVTVRPVFTAGSIATTGETICYGGDPGMIGSSADASGGDGSITYKWQANGVDIASSNSATFNPPAGLNTTTTYTRWAKDNSCNTSFIQSAGSWVVSVTPLTSVSSQSTAGQTLCAGGLFSSISVTASGAGLSYQWYSNSTASTTGGINLGNANGAQTNTYTPQASSPGTLYYYCVVTGTCGSATSSVSGAFVVNALPVPSFTVSPGAQECQNDDVVYTTQSGQANYVWNVQGTAGVDYSITSGGIGPTSYTVAIKWLTTGNKTVTVNYDNSNGCSGATAATSTTNVSPIPSPGNITTD